MDARKAVCCCSEAQNKTEVCTSHTGTCRSCRTDRTPAPIHPSHWSILPKAGRWIGSSLPKQYNRLFNCCVFSEHFFCYVRLMGTCIFDPEPRNVNRWRQIYLDYFLFELKTDSNTYTDSQATIKMQKIVFQHINCSMLLLLFSLNLGRS